MTSCDATGQRKVSDVATRKVTSRGSTTRKRRTKFAKLSRLELIHQLIGEVTFEPGHIAEVDRLLKLSRAQLEAEAWKAERAERARDRRAARTPCPRGHKPGTPECDLMCWIEPIQPFDLPLLFSTMPSTRTGSMMHSWDVDPRGEALEPLAKMYRGLVAQFDSTLDREAGGWWWRKPYGWLLKFFKSVTRPYSQMGHE